MDEDINNERYELDTAQKDFVRITDVTYAHGYREGTVAAHNDFERAINGNSHTSKTFSQGYRAGFNLAFPIGRMRGIIHACIVFETVFSAESNEFFIKLTRLKDLLHLCDSYKQEICEKSTLIDEAHDPSCSGILEESTLFHQKAPQETLIKFTQLNITNENEEKIDDDAAVAAAIDENNSPSLHHSHNCHVCDIYSHYQDAGEKLLEHCRKILIENGYQDMLEEGL